MRSVFQATAWLLAAAIASLSPAHAQQPGGPPASMFGGAVEQFAGKCLGCHGDTLAGGRAPSLFSESLLAETTDAALAKSILNGLPKGGMPAFKDQLSQSDINQLIAYLRIRGGQLKGAPSFLPNPDSQIIRSEKQTFKIEVVAADLNTPWGAAFLPDGRLLLTERPGRIRSMSNGTLSEPVKNTPIPWVRQDGGFFDIAIDPDYQNNGWVYLSYSAVAPGVAQPPPDVPGTPRSQLAPAPASMTRWVRGRINGNNEWVDQQDVLQTPAETYSTSVIHYGSRFFFDQKGRLFITAGERGEMSHAQDLSSPLGKIHRINVDGSIPKDNPFVKMPGAVPSIWTLGNRNPEGLAIDPRSGLMWGSDNGPIGGDELNLVEKGHNYGWGVVSMGIEPGINKQHQRGMDDPIRYYTPSIAPSGIHFYTGNRYPGWKNSLFLSALAGQRLIRYEIRGRKVVHEEVVFKGFGRVRQVITGPDGYLYVLIQNSQSLANSPGMVIRLLPQKGGG
jgi:glucose/arabinose dehydrogenase